MLASGKFLKKAQQIAPMVGTALPHHSVYAGQLGKQGYTAAFAAWQLGYPLLVPEPNVYKFR